MTVTTPRSLIDSVVRSASGREVRSMVRLTAGGLNEASRVEPARGEPMVVRIARRPEPWFVDEEYAMAQARGVGIPTPDVLGVEQVNHAGELLSFSILQLLPGRPLEDLAGDLPAPDLERLVIDCGELLARLHSVVPDRGRRHQLEAPTRSPSPAPCASRTRRLAPRPPRLSSVVLACFAIRY